MTNGKDLITISLINPITVVIFLAFFFAKIFDKIDWSWWLVFSPLWLPAALVVSIIILAIIVYLSIIIIEKIWQ